jgi:hypothetical protein
LSLGSSDNPENSLRGEGGSVINKAGSYDSGTITRTDDDNLDGEEAVKALVDSEREELVKDKKEMMKLARNAEGEMRIGLGKMLGGKLDKGEIESIAEEVENELEDNANEELEEDAEEIIEEEITDTDMDTELEVEEATEEVRMKIHNSAKRIEDHLKKKTAEIEKHILEERLSTKLGKTVKLVIVEDEVEDVDHLLDGLHALTNSEATTSGTTDGGAEEEDEYYDDDAAEADDDEAQEEADDDEEEEEEEADDDEEEEEDDDEEEEEEDDGGWRRQ